MGLFGKQETAPQPTIFDQAYLSISPQGEVPVSVALRPTSNSIRYAGGFSVQDSVNKLYKVVRKLNQEHGVEVIPMQTLGALERAGAKGISAAPTVTFIRKPAGT